jgi:hypothetical protein
MGPGGREAAMVSTYTAGAGKRYTDAVQTRLGLALAQMHSVPVPPTGLPETIDSDNDPDSASAGDLPTAMAGLEYTGKYGFAVPTHCGANEQDNRWEESWEVFFRDRRLGHIIHLLNDKRVGTAWEEMKERWVERDASLWKLTVSLQSHTTAVAQVQSTGPACDSPWGLMERECDMFKRRRAGHLRSGELLRPR